MYYKFRGEIYLPILKDLTSPLILLCLVSAIGSLDLKISGKISRRAILFSLSIVLGIRLVITVQPGVNRERISADTLTKVSSRHKNMCKIFLICKSHIFTHIHIFVTEMNSMVVYIFLL